MGYTYQNCKLIGHLEKVKSLEKRITTLRDIKEGEEFINRILKALHREGDSSQRDNDMADCPNKSTPNAAP